MIATVGNIMQSLVRHGFDCRATLLPTRKVYDRAVSKARALSERKL